MKKLIIAAYQCMGKSTLVNENKNYYDHDSSDYDKTNKDWYIKYIQDAIDSLEKYDICFISTHPNVLDELEYQCDNDRFEYYIFYPNTKYINKDEMDKRLATRYFNHPTIKNANALVNNVLHYNDNINHLMNRKNSIPSDTGYIDLSLIK